MGKNPYDQEVRTVLEIYNDAWADNWCSLALTESEMTHLGKAMRPIIDKNLVKIAEVNGIPVGMIVLFPNVSEAITDLDGRLLPFGWAKLLWRLKVKKVKTARVALMGIRREYAKQAVAGAMLPFLLIDAVFQTALTAGYRMAELSWILEDNMPMRRVIENFGGTLYKTYRMYQKDLM